eukprot:GHVU01136559.1.p1 GENE.GHVU01136559.1~~GHVU01136559.1.p1  ORF type:complete len:334 (+),score=6.81 GHVU01136559.1:674-1675(+)
MQMHPLPFAGKTVLLTGDFRQPLPIDEDDTSNGVNSIIKKSPLWRHFVTLQLNENMRMRENSTTEAERRYIRFVDDLGNGRLQETPVASITLPEGFTASLDISAALDWNFPDFLENHLNPEYLRARIMMAPKHRIVNKLTAKICSQIPSPEHVSMSCNRVSQDYLGEFSAITPQYLATFDPPNFPLHQLSLRVGMTIMMLRNLDPPRDICNGTRLLIRSVITNPWLVVASPLEFPEVRVAIPRIKLPAGPRKYGFRWSRTQFPILPGYCATINKAQGQTVEHAGIYLEEPVFAHGHLYTAATRSRCPLNVNFFVPDPKSRETTNIIYREVLRD